jgi:uncharacterized protein
MMMALGFFVFERRTIPYQQAQHDIVWRHPSQNRVSARPSSQFLGVGDETMVLSGTLLPEFTGGELSLEVLRKMADSGSAFPLIEGTGTVYGFFVIEKISRSKSEFFNDGAAKQIEFSMDLKRVDTETPGLSLNRTIVTALRSFL